MTDAVLKAAKAHLLATQPMITQVEVVSLLGSLPVDLLVVEGKYPEFQFDRVRRWVYPLVKDVNRLLRATEDPWGAWSWWTGPNGRLPDGQAPKDLLGDPEREPALIKIAEAITEDGF